MNTPGAVLLAPTPSYTQYDAMYYLKGAAAGGICCSITHGALTPVDVVKTRVQLDPVKVCEFGPTGSVFPCRAWNGDLKRMNSTYALRTWRCYFLFLSLSVGTYK